MSRLNSSVMPYPVRLPTSHSTDAPVNALSMALIDALLLALVKKRGMTPAVRAVDHQQRPKKCSVPGSTSTSSGARRAIQTREFLEKLYFALNDMQYRMGKPTIAAIDGAVRAGGMTIAISCDMIVAGEASTFAIPGDRCRPDSGDPFCAAAAAGGKASGVRTRCFLRGALRRRDRVPLGAV